MTPEELEVVKLRLKVEALWTLVRGLYTGLAGSSPDAAQHLIAKIAELRRQSEQVAIKGVPAEYSDLISAEYSSALGDFLTDLEKKLRIRG